MCRFSKSGRVEQAESRESPLKARPIAALAAVAITLTGCVTDNATSVKTPSAMASPTTETGGQAPSKDLGGCVDASGPNSTSEQIVDALLAIKLVDPHTGEEKRLY